MDDLISRQKAIMDAESWGVVDEYEKHLQKNVIEWLKEFPPAELGTDTISRQAAAELVMKYCPDDDGAVQCDGDIRELLNELEDLPSAQPEPHWIPCSERMPEEHEWMGTKMFGTTISDEVYVTFENEKGEKFCQHINFQNGELSRYDQFHMDTWFKGSKPIAWMPLPEAYKPNNK